jgi:PIN like domain
MPPERPAVVRFYIDADILGLAKVLVQVRPDVTYPGDPGGTLHRKTRPACLITSPAVKDHVWIPKVTSMGWLIITRDSRIASNRAEIATVRESGARVVALTGAETAGTWAQLEVICSQWRTIERRSTEPGPFIYSATRTTLRQVSLD